MDVRFQSSVAIARTEHSSFFEREHAALEGLHDENRRRFPSGKLLRAACILSDSDKLFPALRQALHQTLIKNRFSIVARC